MAPCNSNSYVCSIIPPLLLEAMCKCDDAAVRESAHRTMAFEAEFHTSRHDYFSDKAASLSGPHASSHGHQQVQGEGSYGIVPDNLQQAVSRALGHGTGSGDQKILNLDQEVRDQRAGAHGENAFASFSGLTVEGVDSTTETVTGFWRGVYDMEKRGDDERPSTFRLLPGKPARLEGQDPSKDSAVNEAYDNALHVLEFYHDKFGGYKSLDNNNMPVKSSVHFDRGLGNAFWLSDPPQMVYGDGNEFIHGFTKCIDVIGHEMTHAVTEYNSALIYQGEAGALNEHLSDVFGIMVKQKVEDETADKADWLIGEGILLPGVKGVALRNMKDPGTAYNDPRFGKDIQPADVAGMVEVLAGEHGDFIRNRDYGGVHVFSGIPNRAFVLVALAFGGYSWEKAGQIWWEVAVKKASHYLTPNSTFIQFADATVDAALQLYGEDAAKTVRDSWNTVGVVRKF